jgi:hypothetical protein
MTQTPTITDHFARLAAIRRDGRAWFFQLHQHPEGWWLATLQVRNTMYGIGAKHSEADALGSMLDEAEALISAEAVNAALDRAEAMGGGE